MPVGEGKARRALSVFFNTRDALVSAGARAVLRERGVSVFLWDDVSGLSAEDRRRSRFGVDVFVFDLVEQQSHDRHVILNLLTELKTEPRGSVFIGLARHLPDPVVTLRAAEAGIDFVMPYDELSGSHEALWRALCQTDERHRLDPPSSIRARLGFAPCGSLRGFLETASRVDDDVWLDECRGRRSGLPRRAVLRLRRAAHEVAGLPGPAAQRYATALRSAPDMPVWADVHRFVRALWGIDSYDRGELTE